MSPNPFPDRPVDKTDAQLLQELSDLRRQITDTGADPSKIQKSGGSLLRHFPLAGLDDARSLLLDLVRDGACILSTQGNIIQCNRAFAHTLGRTRDELVGTSLFDVLTPKDREAVRALLAPRPAEDQAEVTFRRSDGSGRRVTLLTQPTALYGFKAHCLLARDLTEERRLVDIVRGDELARIVFEQAAEAVVVCDADGKILRANRRATALAGQLPDLIHIDEAFRFVPRQRGEPAGVHAWLKQATITPLEVDLTLPDGRTLHFLAQAGRINNARATFLGWVITFVDISTRVAAERQSREWAEREKELNESLRSKNAELEQFAFVASHDLQEPLRKINAFGDLLGDVDGLPDKAKEYVERMRQAADRMSMLIDDLLQYARATPHEDDFETVDMAAVFRDAASQFEGSDVTIEADPLPQVRGVRTLLHQLFVNLLGNAVKYRGTAAPVIRVGAQKSGDLWEFRVADNGIGIDPRYSERIFQLFERLHTRKQYLGTGIGLAICKRIVERHGGRIWVESALGQGATFRFTIPAA